MNADRLIRRLLDIAFRRGVKHHSNGQKPDTRIAQAQKSLQFLNRGRRL